MSTKHGHKGNYLQVIGIIITKRYANCNFLLAPILEGGRDQ